MDAVIIGVSDRSILSRHGSVKDYPAFVKEYGQFLSSRFDNLIILPDDGVYTDVAEEFARLTGKKVLAFYPDKDYNYGISHIKKNFDKYDVKPIGGDWYKLNAELTNRARVVIVLGFSPGSVIELSFVKYHQKYGKINLFIDERCIGRRLPESFEEQIIGLRYFSSLEELGRILDETHLL